MKLDDICPCQEEPINTCANLKDMESICLCADIGFSIETGLAAYS